MASNGTGFTGGSALTVADESAGGFWPLGDVARVHLVHQVVGDSEPALAWAGAAIARVEQEIDRLWCDSMRADDRAMSQRLAELSHALQRAARLLEREDAIG
jgi:hypothetical protein